MTTPLSNRLGTETSPYLLQHRDNPVHWQPWDDQAFALARGLDRPILLSIGYSSCHWCHVMAHESFEDENIAARLNRDFIPVKLDREERPDLDALYQHALGLLGVRGGWPATLFLTPDGMPFWGGTYFPPQERYGRPAFGDVLDRVAKSWKERDAIIGANAGLLTRGLADLSAPRAGDVLNNDDLDRIAARVADAFDRWDGGFGQAPKFPHVPMLALAWSAWKRGRNELCRDGVLITLDRMCQGGIFDHVGGGFARYSTDERWLVPHFEKMLYDNALMLEILTAVWTDTRKPLYAKRIERTVAWALSEMRLPCGAFAGSQDADWNGEEGGYYVWTRDEVDRVLGEDSPLFRKVYEIGRIGNFEQGRSIPNRLDHPDDLGAETEALLDRCLDRLAEARRTRAPPPRDDKVLADWNGMMIAALARAGLALDRPDWIKIARQSFDFLANMEGGPRHSWCAGIPGPIAQLDDWAQMIRAALLLAEATGDRSLAELAESWTERVHAGFGDGRPGYLLTAKPQMGESPTNAVAALRIGMDQPNPSGNGVMLENLARLFLLTGKDVHRDRALAIAQAFGGVLGGGFGFGTLINAQDLLLNAVRIVQVGGDPDLWRAIQSVNIPTRVLSRQAEDGGMPPGVHICRGQTCLPPVSDGKAVEALLLGL